MNCWYIPPLQVDLLLNLASRLFHYKAFVGNVLAEAKFKKCTKLNSGIVASSIICRDSNTEVNKEEKSRENWGNGRGRKMRKKENQGRRE